MLETTRLDELLDDFKNRSIALLGDLFLDRYLEVDTTIQEDSIETGIPVHHVEAVRNSPGALGTVLNNMHAMGAGRLVPITVIGDDGHGHDLLGELEKINVDTTYMIRSPQRLTPTYIKPIVPAEEGRWRELNRIDIFTRAALDDSTCHRLAKHLEAVLPTVDGLVILDQLNSPEEGILNSRVRRLLGTLQNDKQGPWMIDSRTNLHAFDCGILKGNEAEICRAWQQIRGDLVTGREAMVQLSRHTSQPVFCTLGESGAAVSSPDGQVQQLPGHSLTGPLDIVGAGDSATSGFFLALTSGATLAESAAIGNLAASITVQKLGTTGTASPGELRAAFQVSQP